MSYIQINIGGKDRGLKFNQLSLEVYTKHIDYNNAVVTSTIYATFYAGLIGNCYVKKEEPDFTFEDVTNWVDEIFDSGRKDEIEKVCDAWAETYVYKEWIKEFQDKLHAILNPDQPKKKVKKVK